MSCKPFLVMLQTYHIDLCIQKAGITLFIIAGHWVFFRANARGKDGESGGGVGVGVFTSRHCGRWVAVAPAGLRPTPRHDGAAAPYPPRQWSRLAANLHQGAGAGVIKYHLAYGEVLGYTGGVS